VPLPRDDCTKNKERIRFQAAEISASRLVDNQTQTEVPGATESEPASKEQQVLQQSRRPSIQERYIFEVSSNRLYPKSALDCQNNGNNATESQQYQHRRQSANSPCSSPEPLNDNRLNGNSERLRDCSDDDHLETLGRKVNEILNANRLMSPMDNGNRCNVVTHGYIIKLFVPAFIYSVILKLE
jgi:mitogen-activated protein kinase kinase kinase 13